MRRALIAIAASSLFLGCNPCNRAKRALLKCPIVASDTIIFAIDDTVYFEGVRVDTLFDCGDTVVIDTGRLKVQLLPIKEADKTTYTVFAECEPDTVIQEGQIVKEVITHKHLVKPNWAERNWYYFPVIGFFLGAISFAFLSRR